MNQVNPPVRWRWLLAALLFVPLAAHADSSYGGLFELLLVALAVGVLLLAGFIWIFIADYRAGQPGIGFGNAVVSLLLLLGWLSSTIQHWTWLTPVLMGLLGVNGWLLARKNLRVAARQLPVWLALGIVGLGWLVGAFMGFWFVLVPDSWRWTRGSSALVWPLISLVLQLPGMVLLTRQFFTRWPTAWPNQTVVVSLQVAGIVAATDALLFLLQVASFSGGLENSIETWRINLLSLLQSIVINLLEIGLVMLGVRWWKLRNEEMVS